MKLVGTLLAALLVFAPISPAEPAPECSVDDASLTWGFKESFRSYISGTIANGEWTVDDGATYETPNFGFAHGSGNYDGSIRFEGSIRFTGHGGILDTTVANPELRFEGRAVTLYLDVRGTTQEGVEIDESAVEFATVDIYGHLDAANGSVSIVDAPATLTAAGAAAFGTYEAGEALDPISLTFTTSEECVPAPIPIWPFLPLGVIVLGVIVLQASSSALLALALLFVALARRRRDSTSYGA